MNLFPEVCATKQDCEVWVLKAPWMHSIVDGFPQGQGPGSLAELYHHEKVRRLPYWFHPPRLATRLTPDQNSEALDEELLANLFLQSRNLLATDFSWPLDAIMEPAHCPDEPELLDPLSLFGSIQRLILLDSMEMDDWGLHVHEALQHATASEKNQLLQTLVHISHEVTRLAPQAIHRAMRLSGLAESCMKNFLDDERDHDVFAKRSLQLLTKDQESCALFHAPLELPLLIDLLAICASTSPLGLATCLFIFEGLSYDSPVWTPWTELAKGDPEHNRRGVGRHTAINEKARHGDIGYQLAKVLPGQSPADACLAIRLTELCMLLRKQLFAKVYSSTGLVMRQIARVGGVETTPGSNP